MDIAHALIEALVQRGVRRVYGVPGDYVLGLFDRFEQSPIEMVCTAGEEGAGFAADAAPPSQRMFAGTFPRSWPAHTRLARLSLRDHRL